MHLVLLDAPTLQGLHFGAHGHDPVEELMQAALLQFTERDQVRSRKEGPERPSTT
jgi:hypothetical protein